MKAATYVLIFITIYFGAYHLEHLSYFESILSAEK